ncbi:MAG: hypothetical protein KDA55_13750, partial [Planctomycetales bacterium]|nr:hypothetical protein [Planctomycetales bacterium]
RVTQGVYRAAKNTAFGTTAGNVNVTYGATVELAGGITVPAESITLSGNGEGTTAAIPLRNVSGTNIWQGDVNLGSNRTGIDVEAGSKLTISGIVSNQGLNKFGGGTLEFAGSANNTFVQTSVLWEGTLELNNSATTNAIPALNDNAEFFVGSFSGTDDSVVLKLLGDNQIADGSFRLRVMPTGLFDVNEKNETLWGRIGGGNNHDALGLEVSAIGSGDVDLNGGTLRIGNTTAGNGRVTLRVLPGGDPVPATIRNGKFELFGGTALNRQFDVNDSAALEDLVISATVTDGGAVGTLQKNGVGRLVLAPSAGGGNSFNAATLVTGGEVAIRHSNSLGSTTGNTTIISGASLLIDGSAGALLVGETLSINGTGLGGPGALVNVDGNNTLNGNIALAGNSRIGVAADRLTVNAAITGGAVNLEKLLPGTLQF